jgi:hypothetical protein
MDISEVKTGGCRYRLSENRRLPGHSTVSFFENRLANQDNWLFQSPAGKKNKREELSEKA